jgi:ribulose-phosphate 3-epimerase
VRIMSVEPGVGGQSFLDSVRPKVRRTREAIGRHGGQIWLQMDGGVGPQTIERCAEAGADVFVTGSAVYAAEDRDKAVRELRALAEGASALAG